MQTKTGRVIAPHGLYISIPRKMKLDMRTRFGKAIVNLRSSLIADLGGEPSTQERLLIDRAIFKTIRLSSYEAESFNTQPGEKEMKQYVSLANSLRLDLQALGLERRMRDITPLAERLKQLERRKEEEGKANG